MARSPRARTARWVIISLSLLFVTLVVYRSTQVAGHECMVCITFHGEQACRTVQGADESEALRGAITNACARISSGVTDTMACERTRPDRQDCRAFN